MLFLLRMREGVVGEPGQRLHRDAGCKMQDAGCRMQDAGCKMQDAGCKMQDARCKRSRILYLASFKHRTFFSYLPAIISRTCVCITMEQNSQKTRVDSFFRSEYQKMLNFVRKNLDERFFGATPEDIVQDVALSLSSRLNLDDQIGNISAYIYRSIRNRITDSLRKKQRKVAIESLEDQEKGNYLLNAIADETTEETEYEGIESSQLREAIAQLRPDEQAVIIATEFEERTYEELADEWEVPLGTLLSRKHRALSKLHKILLNKNNENHGNN